MLTIYLIAGTDNYKIVKSKRGKDLIMFHGYTYCLSYNNMYYCSIKMSKCKARLKLDKHTKLLTILNEEHSHPRTKYIVTRYGDYIKI